MKRLLTVLVAAALLPLAALTAKPLDYSRQAASLPGQSAKALNATFDKILRSDRNAITPSFLRIPKKLTNQWDTVNFRYLNMGMSGVTQPVTQIIYEPQTNSVLCIYPDWDWTSDNDVTYSLNADIYSNGGESLAGTMTVGTYQNAIVGWINADAINDISGNTDPAKLNIMVNGLYYPQSTKYYATGEGMVGYDGLAGKDPVMTMANAAPSDAQYSYSIMPSIAATQGDMSYYIMGAPLFAISGSSAKHGRYSFLGFENHTDHSVFLNQFAQEFGVDKFKAPTSTGIYNSQVQFGRDDEGTVYALINNIYTDNENRRYPAVAKSTDLGNTWTAFDKMPWDVLNTFALSVTNNQYEADDITCFLSWIDQGSFVVTGTDEFSYATNLACIDKANDYYYWYGPVEIYKKNGSWGIRKIDDFRGWSIATNGDTIAQGYDQVDFYYTADGIDGKAGIVRDFSSRGHELEISKTADNQYVVAKWVEYKYKLDSSMTENGHYLKDYAAYAAEIPDSFVVNYQDAQDAWHSSYWTFYRPQNIYVRYRKIDEDTWSDAINITDDAHYHMNTHMPKVLPNFTATSKRVPLETTITRAFSRSDSLIAANNLAEYAAYKKGISPTCWDMVYSYNKEILYTCVDLAQNVEGVKEESLFNVGVYPNPASSSFTVKAETEGMNRVEIYTVLGEKVMEVSGVQSSFDINSAALSNGVYVVKVINKGNVSTAMITIAK